MALRYSNSDSINNPQPQFNTAHRNAFVATQYGQSTLVMVPPKRNSFIQPLPLPSIPPIMVPVPDYSPFWWDRPGPSYPPPHIHPRGHRFSNHDTTDRGVRKRK